jgi:hypothetical protein
MNRKAFAIVGVVAIICLIGMIVSTDQPRTPTALSEPAAPVSSVPTSAPPTVTPEEIATRTAREFLIRWRDRDTQLAAEKCGIELGKAFSANPEVVLCGQQYSMQGKRYVLRDSQEGTLEHGGNNSKYVFTLVNPYDKNDTLRRALWLHAYHGAWKEWIITRIDAP